METTTIIPAVVEVAVDSLGGVEGEAATEDLLPVTTLNNSNSLGHDQ